MARGKALPATFKAVWFFRLLQLIVMTVAIKGKEQAIAGLLLPS